jgi:arginine exporter protein ArgO
MTNIRISDALLLAIFCSVVLFVTGISSIHYAVQFDEWTQNFVYFLGRIPILFFVILVYFNGVKNE